MSKYPQIRSASIPALWAVQRRYGWCSPEGIREAAAVMGVSPAYLESVASFYDLFATEPVGRHRVLVCTNISCWMNGADELLDAFERRAAPRASDGEFYVRGFECLGACDIAPMASLDDVYYGPLELGDAATALDQLRAGDEVLPDKRMSKRPLGRRPTRCPIRPPSGADGELRSRMLYPRGRRSRALATLEGYRALGGYTALEKAFREMDPGDLLQELEASGLRGRGGAGFSMGKKASFLPRGEHGQVPVLQRRRVRARRVQGPRADA